MPFSRMTLFITTLSCKIESMNLPFLDATTITWTSQRHSNTWEKDIQWMILYRKMLRRKPFSRMTFSVTSLSRTMKSMNLSFLGATTITRTAQWHGDTQENDIQQNDSRITCRRMTFSTKKHGKTTLSWTMKSINLLFLSAATITSSTQRHRNTQQNDIQWMILCRITLRQMMHSRMTFSTTTQYYDPYQVQFHHNQHIRASWHPE